ncbi:MAG: dihydroxyacetone kinase subunit DhaK [Opitutaceae bacterium]
MSHFINARTSVVTEALDGFLLAQGDGRLGRLDGFNHTKVILRTDWDRSRVALISGGGSGHEPSHAGFVGEGMLTAAVCGEVFASPSVDAVLSAILAVTGSAGCLLIVKNYTGDRLNFGLAAERARQRGLKVEMVVVGDDVALPDAPHPRGVAGTVFVHKIAGHVAAQGGSLAEVRAAAADVAASVASLGMALSTCTRPGDQAEERISAGRAELGLGIHGEPGARELDAGPAHDMVATMVAELRSHVPADFPVAVLVNNLGGTTPLEMAVVTKALLESELGSRIELLVGPAGLMTALDMHGISLSVLPLNAARRTALTSAVPIPAWPAVKAPAPIVALPLPAVSVHTYAGSASPAMQRVITAVCAALAAGESEFNELDRRIGDGDTGSTFATAARAVSEAMARGELPLAEPAALCSALGDLLSRNMGASSGVLLSIGFTAAGRASADGAGWPAGFRTGLDRMCEYGGAAPGDRTMIDALAPAVDAWPQGGLAAAAQAARTGADATATMARAQAGRSSYVNARNLAGVPDPGAMAMARVFEAAARA